MRIILILAWAILAHSISAATPRPNIVFLVADDMRPDAIGAFGHGVVRTPHLDALVKEGTVFTRAVVGYPICFVSRAEFFTGRAAFRSGVQYRGNRMSPEIALWPETFRKAGYRTSFAGKWHNDGHPKTRGFEETGGLFSSGGALGKVAMRDHAGRPATGYRGWTFKTEDGVVEEAKGVGLTPDTDRYIADGAIDLLRRESQRPFFLQVSFAGPHDPRIWPRGREGEYKADGIPLPRNFAEKHPFDHGNAEGRDEVILSMPRRPEEVRAELAVYYSVISQVDEQVGRIISALREMKQLENTIVIFTSDHGLAMGSHGLMGKQNMYEHTISVPLIMRGPGMPKGSRIAAQCYLRDLYPTTCDLAGIPIPSTVESRSLVPAIEGTKAEIHPAIFGAFTDTQRMIRTDRWKLIWYPKLSRYQLFDVQADRDELRDLSEQPEQASRIGELRKQLEGWLKEQGDPLFDRG